MFRKYCDYQKYELFHALQNELKLRQKLTEDAKDKIVNLVTSPDDCWRAVFMSMGFAL